MNIRKAWWFMGGGSFPWWLANDTIPAAFFNYILDQSQVDSINPI